MIVFCFLSLTETSTSSPISYKVLPLWTDSVWKPLVPLLSGLAGPLLWGQVHHDHHSPRLQPCCSSVSVLSLHIPASGARGDLPRGGLSPRLGHSQYFGTGTGTRKWEWITLQWWEPTDVTLGTMSPTGGRGQSTVFSHTRYTGTLVINALFCLN